MFFVVDCLEGEHQITTVETRSSSAVIENHCSPCPLNTYQDVTGGESCIPCPENHITFNRGTKSKDECIGEYINSNIVLLYGIAVCPPNTNSSTGLGPCQRCPNGTYQPDIGQTFCLPCQNESDDIACISNKYNYKTTV